MSSFLHSMPSSEAGEQARPHESGEPLPPMAKTVCTHLCVRTCVCCYTTHSCYPKVVVLVACPCVPCLLLRGGLFICERTKVHSSSFLITNSTYFKDICDCVHHLETFLLICMSWICKGNGNIFHLLFSFLDQELIAAVCVVQADLFLNS